MLWIVTLLFTQITYAATCGVPDKCKALGVTAGQGLNAGMTAAAGQTTNVPGQASGLATATSGCAANFTTAASKCSTMKSECAACGKTAQAACESAIDSMITSYTAQSASCAKNSSASLGTQSASSSDSTGMLMGALAGAAAGYMLGKQSAESSSTTSETTDSTAALTKNGLDCSKADAYRYVACDATMVSACAYTADSSSSTSNGVTVVSSSYAYYGSSTCQSFVSRYCASTIASGGSVSADGSTYYDIDSTGAGLGSSFCQNIISAAYCSVGGRSNCPSCLNLANATSDTCLQNPAACLTQNSSATLAASQANCPTDPVYSDPNYTSSSQSGTSSANATAAVVLPQSVGNGTTDTVGSQYGPSLFTITQSAISKWESKTK